MKQQSSLTKGQIYTIDFLIAILLFSAVAVISLKLIFNTEDSEDYNILQLEARAISDALLSEGVPSDWRANDVILPGILSDGQIDIIKLKEIQILGYYNLSGLYHTRKHFYFYFANASDIINVTYCGFGGINSTCNTPEIEANNLARLDRITVHNNEAIKLVMLVWD